jgi:cytochrome P450
LSDLEFRATRSPNPHLGFGEGNPCLGANLASARSAIALEQTSAPGAPAGPGAKLIPKLTALANGVERMDAVCDFVQPRSGSGARETGAVPG